ncbi:MAG: putative baseplate assembly protein [Blastocatellia bacterium]
MIYFCCDERRRNAVKEQTALNGIDFLEVSDNPADPVALRQRTLFVNFIHPLAPASLKAENIRIEGGERIRHIKVTGIEYGLPASPPSGSPPAVIAANVLAVRVAEAGDFSTYTLRLVVDADHDDPPAGFDPILSAVDFSFKVACPSDFDCQSARVCPPEQQPQPDINYLAKDYAGFRQLMLDRMAALMPQWKERNAADVGIALIELLAYVGDYLSYQQDATATESYLGTARRRTSVRRHARLVDYTMHDGSNARAWVQVIAQPGVSNAKLKKVVNGRVTKLLTRTTAQPAVMQLNSPVYEKALRERPQVFELMHDITLFAAHNEMKFYTWSALECCLPKGATRATLRGGFPNLKPGDVLILAEVRGPLTGEPEDADPTHRCAVRLTEVKQSFDPLFGPLTSPPNQKAVLLTEITWHQDDALPFALCISARNGTALYENISVALGNIVLADHGLTIEAEELPPVPSPNPALTKVAAATDSRCAERTVTLTPPRFRPSLRQSPLTHAAPFDPEKSPASANATMRWSTDSLLPVIALTAPAVNADEWQPKRDLISSHANATEFVVEIESDGQAFLRFGDNQSGARPESGTQFVATYRTGNGVVGNIGADSLAHLASNDAGISDQVIAGVRNPLPARGGLEPESIEQVRQNAPQAFRTQERAVTPDDYAAVALRCSPEVQRAAATMRWTGSWRTVFLTIDRIGGREVDDSFETSIRQCLERFRMAGHDLEVDGPLYVPLEVEMIVCVKAGYLVSDVKAALLEVFSSRVLPDGRRGIFHPDNFTFGQPVFLSRLMAAAQAVAGVDSVEVTKFQRQGRDSDEAIKSGRLELGRLEIAQLDNDPNFRERGSFNLIMRGGR